MEPERQIITVDHFSYKPEQEWLDLGASQFRQAGWQQVVYKVSYERVGYPYRVEYWGIKL